MQRYPKIQTLFKRDQTGKMLRDQWTTPELQYLAPNQWDFTEKVDGMNLRIGWNHFYGEHHEGVLIGGRTAAAELPPHVLQPIETIFTEERLNNVFPVDHDLPAVTLYGEAVGPKVQKGGRYGEEHFFILFDVKVGDFWLDHTDVEDIAHKLDIPVVPHLGSGTLYDAIDIVESGLTFNSLGAVKRWGNGGLNSHWGNFEAEGIVARPSVQMFDRKGERIITKIKAVDFK